MPLFVQLIIGICLLLLGGHCLSVFRQWSRIRRIRRDQIQRWKDYEAREQARRLRTGIHPAIPRPARPFVHRSSRHE